MLCTLFSGGGISAKIGDFPIVSDNMRLSGDERIIHFNDVQGEGYAAISTYKIDSKLLQRALIPNNNVYDLRELQVEQSKQALKTFSRFGRHKGKLGVVVGMVAGSVLMLSSLMQGFMDSYKW